MLFAESQAKKVAGVVDWWLGEEVQNAASGRNSVLDNYNDVRGALASGPSAENVGLQAKADSHFIRYRLKLPEYGRGTADRFYLASVHHHALMFTAGGFRRECMLRSADQDEYYGMRASGSGTSLETLGVVKAAFTEVQSKRLYGEDAIGDFVAWHLVKNDEVLAAKKAIDSRAVPVGVRLGADSDPVAAAREVQRLGIVMAVSSIVMSASLLGGYDQAPFLEPKSITDVSPQPIYPLAA